MVKMSMGTFVLLPVLKWPLALVYTYLKFAIWWLTLPLKIIKALIESAYNLFVWVYIKITKML